ncbi:MAG TPA: hypothetical protein PKW80_15700 [Bacteroidales bacterium]|nr:hypothetical protein [Bacteroidales bacterium]
MNFFLPLYMVKKFFRLYFRIIVLLTLLAPATGHTQNIYSSKNGIDIPPKVTMRMLNIFINIIYDQTPDRDPLLNKTDHPWQPGKPNSINTNVPSFLNQYMDPDLTGSNPQGMLTRYYYESSLGNFICLGDFILVDVNQSAITPDKPGRDFSSFELINAAVSLINKNGGVKTVYGHDSLSDYDFFERGRGGLPKKITPNGKIDFVQIVFRNTGRVFSNGKQLYNYGQNNPGEGNYMPGGLNKGNMLMFNNKPYENEMMSYQNLGMTELLYMTTKTIVIHEFAHSLLGGNDFHTSGGNHYGTYSACPFIGLQGGWGLMGGYGASLASCNAYERWRLGWTSNEYNPMMIPVQASGVNADITKDMGQQTFILRDFVTTGDAVRIKLPYLDEGASNQYIWLENHQIGLNNKYDYLCFSPTSECRDKGLPGIYAYLQIGRDKLEGEKFNDVFPSDETDNLKVITAKGNWDRQLISLTDTVNCVAWRSVNFSESCFKPNPFLGYVDEQSHFFVNESTADIIDDKSFSEFPSIIYRKGIRYDNLPYLGDNFDAFTDGAVMDIGTNPAPVNAVTCYVSQGGKKYKTYKKTNTRHIYLTGLSITMHDLKDGTFKVSIGWDDYTVKNNTRWTGNVIVKEKMVLQKRKTILLDQNYTPDQLRRDSISGYFSPVTTLTVQPTAAIILEPKSKLIIDNGSSLILEPSSKLTLNIKSQIILKNNARLIIRKGAEITYLKGKIITKGNGKIITEP